ncbi:MAG: FAD-dependent oxidoreductase [Pseudomonadota bacterium]
MTDVLICGAGPTGLALAIELAKRGVDVRVVERDAVMPSGPRALVVKPSTLYAAEQMGVLDEVVAGSVPSEAVLYSFEGRTVLSARSPERRWPWSINLGEDVLIPIMTARLEGLGVVVERGLTLTDVVQDEKGVTATLHDRAGHDQKAQAAWLVGADGVHSTVRDKIGVSFDGHDISLHWHVLDAQIDGWSYGDTYGVNFLDPVFMAIYRTKSAFRIYTITREPLADSWSHARDYLSERIPDAVLGPAISDNAFHCAARLASAYRKGRVLLAGDATHSMSPASAAGLNTGLQDAINLGWKLAAVVKGDAATDLLETYEAERRPVAEATCEFGHKNDCRWIIEDPVERSRAIREFAVSTGAAIRDGANGYSQIMGAYGPSVIASGERPAIGPGPGDFIHADLRLRHINGDAVYLTSLLTAPTHTVLVSACEGGPEADRLVASALAFAERNVGDVDVVVVAHDAETAAARRALDAGEGVFYLDSDLDMHNRLGVIDRAVSWIRPDGRIGCRADGTDNAEPVIAAMTTALPGLAS